VTDDVFDTNKYSEIIERDSDGCCTDKIIWFEFDEYS